MTTVFIHGAGCTKAALREQRAAFTDGHAPDLPGRPSQTSGPQSVGEFADFLQLYVSSKGLGDAVLCGHSMGAAVALTVSLEKPAWLRGVVLLGAGARLRVAPWIFDRMDANFEAFAPEFVAEYYFAEPTLELVSSTVSDMVDGAGQPQTRRDFRACDAFDVLARLGEIRVPLLAITGEYDKMTPPKYAQTLADRVPGAQARIVSGAGHFVMAERPEETNAAIRSFLSGIT